MQIRLRNRYLFGGLILVTTVCLFYWIIRTEISSPLTIIPRLLQQIRSPKTCLKHLLFEFRIDESRLDQSEPIYATLSQAKPLSKLCQRQVANSYSTYNTTSDVLEKFSKLKLLDEAAQNRIYEIAHQLYSKFSQRNLEIFLGGGSLLGSVRHLGFVPWDADVDLMIRVHQKPAVRQLLEDLSKSSEFNFVDTERSNQHWQLGILCTSSPQKNSDRSTLNSTQLSKTKKSCKTLVDFFFGRVDKSGSVEEFKRAEWPYLFPVKHVYPLGVRPFGRHLLPVPNKPDLFLSAVFGQAFESQCLFKYFNNKKIECSKLNSLYPFVKHLRLPYKAGKSIRVDLLVRNSQMLALFIPKQ